VGSKSTSYMDCLTQIYFFITFINMDGFSWGSWPVITT
jgi:olfactory receptor